MSPTQRDPDGTRRIAPSWESLIERQIREAMDDGRFDGLPHHGERLPLEDDSLSGDRAMAHRLLKNAGVAPGWIEADKHARVLIDERDRLLRQAPRHSSFACCWVTPVRGGTAGSLGIVWAKTRLPR